jgi:deazaflavin-dependent oxidoreductase (nitroreductase family)
MIARMPVWARRSLAGFLGSVGFLVLVDLVPTAAMVVSWRTGWRPGLDANRWYNKKMRNPAMLRLGISQVTAIHHMGRRSGTEYVTPVWAERIGQSFFIHLPYGTGMDWCRNILAAGGCAVEHDGTFYETAAAEIVPAAEAVPLLPARMRRVDRLFGVESYLRLNITPVEEPVKQTG